MYDKTLEYARKQDDADELREFRDAFYFPEINGAPSIYMCGNSLGLQPRRTEAMILQELQDWKNYGVEGHFEASNPWMPYHEFLTEAMAHVVGAKNHEVVVMNTLTVNLHLMMVSFYRPVSRRNKVLIEFDAFPSDKYAIASQIRFHGLKPDKCMIQLKPRQDEDCLRHEDIIKAIEECGDELALVMLGNTNYYTGQFFDMKAITKAAHSVGAMAGFHCAHGAGNVELNLHNSGADFAVWCSYKYLNSGPGSIAACFVHERHANDKSIPRFEGWWGHNKETRFGMRDDFEPIYGVEAWQLSNPPILSMAAVWSSLKLFQKAGMDRLRAKSIRLTGYLEYLLDGLNCDKIKIISPRDPIQRGSQLSVKISHGGRKVFEGISKRGVISDWRDPDVIRVAPTAMYNNFEDVNAFVRILDETLKTR